MIEKNFKNVRIKHKHDIEANWLKALNFKPLAGEIIIYDPEKSENDLPKDDQGNLLRTDYITFSRFKVGDGEHNINELPFINKNINIATNNMIDSITNTVYEDSYLMPSFTLEVYSEDKVYIFSRKFYITREMTWSEFSSSASDFNDNFNEKIIYPTGTAVEYDAGHDPEEIESYYPAVGAIRSESVDGSAVLPSDIIRNSTYYVVDKIYQ